MNFKTNTTLLCILFLIMFNSCKNDNRTIKKFTELNFNELTDDQIALIAAAVNKNDQFAFFSYEKIEETDDGGRTISFSGEIGCSAAHRKVCDGQSGMLNHNLKATNNRDLSYWLIEKAELLSSLKKTNVIRYPGIIVYPALDKTVDGSQDPNDMYHTLVFGPVDNITTTNGIKSFDIIYDKKFYDFVDPCPDNCARNIDRSFWDNCPTGGSTDPCR